PERLREGPRGEGLAEARHVLEEHMTAGEDAGEHELEGGALADHRGLDGVEDLLGGGGGGLEGEGGVLGHQCLSSRGASWWRNRCRALRSIGGTSRPSAGSLRAVAMRSRRAGSSGGASGSR